jgi:hypothetical protein
MMRIFRILLVAWVSVIAMIIALPSLRPHLKQAVYMCVGKKLSIDDVMQLHVVAGKQDSELVAAIHTANRASSSSPNFDNSLDPLLEYIQNNPEDLGAKSVFVRLSIRSNGNPITRDFPGSKKWIQTYAEALNISQSAQKIEPNNWYWRIGEVTSLRVLGRITESKMAMKRTPLPNQYNERQSFEIVTLNNFYKQTFWGQHRLYEVEISAGQLFPNYGVYRNAQLKEFQEGNRDFLSQKAWLSFGTALLRESETNIGGYIGRSFIYNEVMRRGNWHYLAQNLKENDIDKLTKIRLEALRDFKSTYSERYSEKEMRIIENSITKKLEPEYFDDFTSYNLGWLGSLAIPASIFLVIVGCLSFVSFQFEAKHFWYIPIAMFIITLPLSFQRFRVESWLTYFGTQQSGDGTYEMKEFAIFCLVTGLTYLMHQKQHQDKGWRILTLVLIAAIGINIQEIGLASVIAMIALVGLDQANRVNGALMALGLAMASFYAMGTMPNTYSPVFLALLVLPAIMISKPKSLPVPLTAIALCSLFIGIGLSRHFDGVAMGWMEVDALELQKLRKRIL